MRFSGRKSLWLFLGGAVLAAGGMFFFGRPSWSTISPGAGSVKIFMSPDFAADSTIFAVTDAGPSYRSSDGGQHWTPIAGLPPAWWQFAFSPAYARDHTLVVSQATQDRLYYSTDGGATWLATPPAPAYATNVAIDGAGPLTLAVVGFAPGKAALYRLADDAASWQKQSLAFDGRDIWFSPTHATDHTMYMTDSDDFYRSADNGATWTLVPRASSFEELIFSPDYARDQTIFGVDLGVWRSTDAGQSWAELHVDLWDCNSNLALSPAFATDKTLMITNGMNYQQGANLFISHDGGTTWIDKPLQQFSRRTGFWSWLQDRECLEAIALSPGYPGDQRVVLATDEYVYLSRDGGAHWTPYGQKRDFANYYLPSYFSHGGQVFGWDFDSGLQRIALPR